MSESSEAGLPPTHDDAHLQRRGMRIRALRDVFEIAAFSAAGIWAIWTFWYQASYAPKHEKAAVDWKVNLIVTGERADGLLAVRAQIHAKNTGRAPERLAGMVVNVFGHHAMTTMPASATTGAAAGARATPTPTPLVTTAASAKDAGTSFATNPPSLASFYDPEPPDGGAAAPAVAPSATAVTDQSFATIAASAEAWSAQTGVMLDKGVLIASHGQHYGEGLSNLTVRPDEELSIDFDMLVARRDFDTLDGNLAVYAVQGDDPIRADWFEVKRLPEGMLLVATDACRATDACSPVESVDESSVTLWPSTPHTAADAGPAPAAATADASGTSAPSAQPAAVDPLASKDRSEDEHEPPAHPATDAGTLKIHVHRQPSVLDTPLF
jgi:hypothetical protein